MEVSVVSVIAAPQQLLAAAAESVPLGLALTAAAVTSAS
jgi:hypothetical protein